MEVRKKILSYLNQEYKTDTVSIDIAKALMKMFEDLSNKISEFKSNFYFNKLDPKGCNYFENLLAITPTETQTLDDRRATIQAKWLSNNHNCLKLIQNVCNAWKRGEVVADFIDGKIRLTFVGEFGVPDDLNSLLNAIDKIKPAHIAYFSIFKYLLIENIHEVKTIEQMEGLTLKMFAFGREEI